MVFPENWQTVELFLRLQTQWQFVNGCFLGLQYTAVDALMRILRIKNRAEVFQDLQVMELAALRVLNEKKG